MTEPLFGEWSLDRVTFDWILDHLPAGSIILEMGSGRITGELAKHYTMYSIEHNAGYVEKGYDTHYIYAPMKDGWYDADVVKSSLPARYDMILIDGPDSVNRPNLFQNLDLFDWSKPVVLDDMQHDGLRFHAEKLANEVCKRPFQVLNGDGPEYDRKKFMVIP